MLRTLSACLLLAVLATRACWAGPLSSTDVRKVAVPEIKKVFGDDRQDTYDNDALLREAILLSIGMPGETRVLGDGTTLSDGCRPHSCMEKAAVIVDGGAQQLRAVGLLHFNCHLVVFEADSPRVASGKLEPENACEDKPILEIFIVRRSATPDALKREGSYLAELRTWAKPAGYVREDIHVKAQALR